MTNKLFHLTSEFKSIESEDEDLKVQGFANTTDKDRVGDVVLKEAWQKGGLENYMNNPILLFNHNYDKPVGRVTSSKITDKGLFVEASISKAAGDVYNMVKEGILKAFSIGFRIKDADYDKEEDIFSVKDLELHEISVVSVPANQYSLFALAKSFENAEEYEKFKSEFTADSRDGNISDDVIADADTSDVNNVKITKSEETNKEILDMTSDELKDFAASVAEKTAASIAMKQAETKAAEMKAAEEAEVKATAQAAEKQSIIEAGMSGAEKLITEVETRVTEKSEELGKVVADLHEELKAKSEEIQSIRDGKMKFADRAVSGELAQSDFEKAYFLSKAMGRRIDETKFARDLTEKAEVGDAFSPAAASHRTYEEQVTTQLQRDMQAKMVLEPLFQKIQMNAATMVMPVEGTAAAATWVAEAARGNAASTGTATAPSLSEITLTTDKLAAKSYLNDEADEDAVLALIPIIRRQLAEGMAKTIEYSISGAITSGGSAYSPSGWNDLEDAAGANAGGTMLASGTVASAQLLNARQNMGVYGVNPSDVIYIVSQKVWYDLLDDTAWADVSQVGAADAMKLQGEVGSIYGSKVIVSTAFDAAANAKTYAYALNPAGFLMPQLRAPSVQSEYSVEKQLRTIVSTQRIGFKQLHSGATYVKRCAYTGA